MWKGIVAFEWRYQTRRLTFAAAALLFAFMGFVTAATRYGSPELHVNSPYSVANSIGLLSLVCVFALTLFSAQSVLRDSEHRMTEIVYTTSVTKGRYLFGRFAGSLAAAAAAFAFALPGMWIGTFLVAHDPSRIGPFDLLDYLWAFAVLALPNMLVAGSLLFAVAALARSTMATYVAGVFVYMLYFIAAMFANSPLIATSSPPTPEGLAFAALADPFGLSAFFEQTHYWTVAERNSRRLVLGGHFLANRLVWTGAAVLVLGLVHRLFAFRLPGGAAGEGSDDAPPAADTAYRPVPVRAGRPASRWLALVSATRSELRHAFRSWPFVALLVMWIGMMWIEVVQFFGHAELGSVLLPTTGLALSRIREPLALVGLLVVVYYSAELVWRERSAGMDEIVDATPVSNAVLLLSKAAALAALLGVLTAVAVAVPLVFQLASGYTRLDLGVYASLLYFIGLPLILVAVLALALQTVTPNRWVGMLATLAAILVLHKGMGGLEHPLLRYAASPEVPFSDMNGFSPAAVSFSWFMAYWTAVAGLVVALTCVVWRRGTDRLWRRWIGWRRWSRGTRIAFLTCGLLAVTTGVSVFYQTNVVNAYETTDEVYDWKAEYERTYRPLETEPQPKIVHVEAAVDLYPGERRYRIRGRYRLENRGDQSVDTVWLAVRRDVTSVELALAGSPPGFHDTRFGMYSFVPERPLAPGANAELAYDLAVEHRGATAGGTDHDVVENGSFLLNTFAFPTVGYRYTYELQSPAARRRRGLAEHARPTTIEGAEAAGMARLHPDRVTFDTTVSTSADQIAVAPGALVKSWEEGGRRYFRYRTDRPMMAYFGYVSARYEVERVRHLGVDVEVYHHPEHGANIGRFVEATKRSLDYFTTHFGPYPHGELRIVEIPAHWERFAGLALPGVIYFVEDRGFLTDLTREDRVDVVTKRVAHEVAHQWWGHQLSPDVGPGASVLVETFARYSELMVLKELYGPRAIPPVLAYETDRYLRGRTGGDEVPLYQVASQPYLFYSKGSVVMMAMHDLLGEEAVGGVLRVLLADALRGPVPPTSLDLLNQFYRVTPEEDHVLVDQWWKEIVLYDLRVVSAVAEPLPDGRCRVAASLEAGKSAVRDGGEKPLEMNEELDVAFYSEHPNAAPGSEIYSGRHRIGAATEIVVEVGECPSYVGVDPYLRRIDRNRVDNVAKALIRRGRREQTGSMSEPGGSG